MFFLCLSVVIEYKTLDQTIETGECHFLTMVRNADDDLWANNSQTLCISMVTDDRGFLLSPTPQ
ncbi:MAG: hypothetical protein ACRCT1_21725 [Microcoleaceae cyanobacterium]